MLIEQLLRLSENGWNHFRDHIEKVAKDAIEAGEYHDAHATLAILMELRSRRMGP